MRTEVEDMRSSGSTVISATDVLAAYNGHKRRGRPRFFFWQTSPSHGPDARPVDVVGRLPSLPCRD